AGATLVATLALAAIGLNNSRWLDIDDIQVVGAQRADTRHIITASGLALGQPLAEIDLAATATAVEAVPWVAAAEIDRAWSGEVVIEVTERVEVAVIPTGARFALVDTEGRQLEVVPQRPGGFLTIAGVEASGVPGDLIDPPARHAVSVAEQLSPALQGRTERIQVDDGQVFLVLDIGGVANLGTDRELGPKMVALETVLDQVDMTCIDTIDVRVPDAPTVRRLAPAVAEEEPLAETGGC
ncbi:MAG: FtsQ-type POTRA domain-containing protein, partial [Actinomycetota bacterium]